MASGSGTTDDVDFQVQGGVFEETASRRRIGDTDRVAIEHRRRDDVGAWRLETLGAGGRLTLEAHGVVIEVDAIYEGVDLAPRPRHLRRRRRGLPERAG